MLGIVIGMFIAAAVFIIIAKLLNKKEDENGKQNKVR